MALSRALTVVLCPPVKVASTDDIVKDKADEHRGRVVERSRRRHVGRGTKDDREIDVFEEI